MLNGKLRISFGKPTVIPSPVVIGSASVELRPITSVIPHVSFEADFGTSSSYIDTTPDCVASGEFDATAYCDTSEDVYYAVDDIYHPVDDSYNLEPLSPITPYYDGYYDSTYVPASISADFDFYVESTFVPGVYYPAI